MVYGDGRDGWDGKRAERQDVRCERGETRGRGDEGKRKRGMGRKLFWMHRGVGTGPETSTTIAGEPEQEI